MKKKTWTYGGEFILEILFNQKNENKQTKNKKQIPCYNE